MLGGAEKYSDAIAVMLATSLFERRAARARMELLRGADLIPPSRRRTPRYHRSRSHSRRDPVPLAPGDTDPSSEPWRTRTRSVLAWRLVSSLRERGSKEFSMSSRRGEPASETPIIAAVRSAPAYEYGASSASPPLLQATAIALIADWDLLVAHHDFAVAGYTCPPEMLEQAVEPEASIQQLFAPHTVMLRASAEPSGPPRRAWRRAPRRPLRYELLPKSQRRCRGAPPPERR